MKGLDDGPDGLNEDAFDRALGAMPKATRSAPKATDLEAQLVASLPGRPTALHDYVRAHQALERVKLAIGQLQSARSELSVIAGDQRRGVEFADEALLNTRKMYADLEVVIRQLARSL